MAHYYANIRYKKLSKLGNGSFGPVWRTENIRTDTRFSMKLFECDLANEIIRQEIDPLIKINHPHLVRVHDAIEFEKQPAIVMELCTKGNLKKYLRKRGSGNFLPEKQVLKWLTELISALAHLEKKDIVHGNIKPENVLLHNNNDSLKLGDYGLAKIAEKCAASASSPASVQYYAPELFNGKPCYSFKSDMFSLGCIVYEMCALSPAFPGGEIGEIEALILENRPQPMSAAFSPELRSLVQELLSSEPGDRPRAADVLQRDLEILQVISSEQGESFDWQGMKPLTASVHGEYSNLDLSTGSWDNREEWNKLFSGDATATLWLPPLCLMNEIQSEAYVVIKVTRDTDYPEVLSVYGSYHKNHHLGIKQQEVTFKATMQLTKRDKTITYECYALITLRIYEDQSFFRWISFWDIPWTDLDPSKLPQFSISLAPVQSMDKFIAASGMYPISASSTGSYTIDWRSLNSNANYEMRWGEILLGSDANVELHTPPLILPKEVSNSYLAVMTLKLDRPQKDKLVLHGSYRSGVAPDPMPLPVKLKFTLDICDSNTEVKSYDYEGTFLLCREWNTVTEFTNLPWESISASIAPIAHIAVSKPQLGFFMTSK